MPPEEETVEQSAEDLARARGDVVDDPAPTPEGAQDPEPAKAEGEGGGEGAGAAAEPEAPAKPASDLIPRSRYNLKAREAREERERRERLEAEIAELRSKPAPQPQPAAQAPSEDLYSAVEAKIAEARRDGDVDAELAAMREMRKIDQEVFNARLDEARSAAVDQAVGHMDWDTTLSAVEDLYPQLNVDDEQYDRALDERVTALVDGFTSSGRYNQAAALMEAIALVFPEQDPAPAPSQPAATSERAVAAVKKGVEAAKAQPPDAAAAGARAPEGVGVTDPTKLDISKLSEEEYAALPESTIRRLRGDNFAEAG